MGVWVYGDGQGEVLNFQLQCPSHVVAGVGEHYIVVDFNGWRYFELIESEGERHAGYTWPYGGHYAIYRERIDFRQIAKLTVWVNNLPANGSATCALAPINAIPLIKAKIRNPRVTVGDSTVIFPVEMESGSYLELSADGDCQIFGSDGKLLQEVKVAGVVPALAAGNNVLRFECDSSPEVRPRVRISTMSTGLPVVR